MRHLTIVAMTASIGLVVGLVGVQPALASQSAAGVDDRVRIALGQLKGRDWLDRARGLGQLLAEVSDRQFNGITTNLPTDFRRFFQAHPQWSEPIRVTLVNLLEAEAVAWKATVHPEDYGDFVANVIAATSALQDIRAVKGLVSVIDSGDLATQGLAALGPPALDAVLQAVRDSNPGRRNGAVRTINQMLSTAMPRFPASSIARIKSTLIAAAADESPYVRVSAIEGLTSFPGADVTSLLKRLAEQDSTVYVQEAARTALRKRDSAVRRLTNL